MKQITRGILILFCLSVSMVGTAVANTAGLSTPGTTNYPTGGMRRAGAVTTNASDHDLVCSAIDVAGGYVYYGSDSSTQYGKIFRASLSNFTSAGIKTLNTGYFNIRCAVIDHDGGYAYFASTNGTIIKVRLSDFTLAGTLRSGVVNLESAGIDPAAGYAYFAGHVSPGKIVRIQLSDFTQAGILTLNAGEGGISAATFDVAGGFAYFGIDSIPAKVVKVQLSDFSRVAALTFNAGEESISCAVIDSSGGFAYFPTYYSAWIVKVRLSDFTRVGAIKSSLGIRCRQAVIDPPGSFLYAGGDSGGIVFKVRLSDFTESGNLALNAAFTSVSIDSDAQFVYFGAILSNGSGLRQIIKMSTSQSGFIKATRFTMPEWGAPTALNFYAHAAAGSFRVALYNDDPAGRSLIWQYTSTPTTIANGFNAVPIAGGTPSSLPLLPPGNYFLAWQTDSKADVPSYTPGASGNGFYITQPYSTFPSEIAVASSTTTNEKWTGTITYNPVPAGAHPPTDINLSSPRSVNENAIAGTIVGQFATADPDADNIFAYSFVAPEMNAANRFKIQGAQLQVDNGALMDFEANASHSIHIRAADQDGMYTDKSFVIAVNDLNEAPTNIGLSGGIVSENSANATLVGYLSSADQDSGNTFVYSFLSPEANAGGRFGITDEQLLVANGPLLNFESRSSWAIRVRSTDQGGLRVDKPLTIYLGDVNEAPTNITLDGDRSVDEIAPNGTLVGTLGTLDPDFNENHVYSFTAPELDAGGRFQIAASQIQTANGSLLNYELKRSHKVRIRSADHGGLVVEKVFTIAINDVNESPSNIGLSGARSVEENAPTGTVVGTLATIDPDAGDSFTYSFVAPESDAGGRFLISASQLQVADGSLLNYETKKSHKIHMRSFDNEGLFTDKIFTIAVTDVLEE